MLFLLNCVAGGFLGYALSHAPAEWFWLGIGAYFVALITARLDSWNDGYEAASDTE